MPSQFYTSSYPLAFIIHDAEEVAVQHLACDEWLGNADVGAIGIIIMVINRRFAHWLGLKIK